jgi:hypothetical protein
MKRMKRSLFLKRDPPTSREYLGDEGLSVNQNNESSDALVNDTENKTKNQERKTKTTGSRSKTSDTKPQGQGNHEHREEYIAIMRHN